jgi:hypothetical protein
MTQRQQTIDLLNIYKQETSERIIGLTKKYESCESTAIYSKKFYKSAILLFKMSNLIIDVILKNNKSLYDKVLLKYKELATEFLETTNECCINDVVNDEYYRNLCKVVLRRVDLTEKLIDECKKVMF